MKAIPIRKEPNMSLAETALAESTEPIVAPPVPGSYLVKSTGTPLVPPNA